jgi:hypothetical protein
MTSDVPVTGTLTTGFSISVGGTASTHILTLSSPTATPQLANGSYAFYLVTTTATEQTSLINYFAGLPGWTTQMVTRINAEINGTAPFFYLNANSGVYTLVDSFKQFFGLSTPYPLTVDDNYPKATYTYYGTIEGSNSTASLVQISLTVK